jgi:hypothetical protein
VRGLKRLLALLLAVTALWPVVASAVDLTGFKTDDQEKKLRFELNFSEVVEAQVVNNYASNFVDIGIVDLKVPRNLARRDHEPENEATAQFYRFTRFMEVEGEQHIRIYLGKYADPSDVQVVPLDNSIEVEMVKPYWKLPPAEAGVDQSAEAAGFIPDDAEESAGDGQQEEAPLTGLREATADSGSQPAGEETETAAADSGGEDTSGADMLAPGVSTGTQPHSNSSSDIAAEQPLAEDQPDAGGLDSGELYGETSLRDLSNGGVSEDSAVGATTNGAELQPVRSLTQPPSYKQFDLNDVPVAQVQLRNTPFNEGLMELVANAGFNVIVGSEVSNEVMTLDFRQKEVSLKRALELLCMVYNLAYIVEDDAIIINSKSQ